MKLQRCCCVLALVALLAVVDAQEPDELTITTVAAPIAVSTTSDNTLKGSLFLRDADSKTIYVVHLRSENSTITEVPVRPKHSHNLTNPFLLPQSSTDQELEPQVYTVFRHHAYIASGMEIVILNLKAEDAIFERLEVGYPPKQLFVYEINEEQYCFAYYENEDGNGFLKRFRKFDNRNWGQYGQPVQMTSESWFNLSRLSNTIVFKADDIYFGSPTVYAALASTWLIFVCNMFDGTYFTLEAPLPCYNITTLNYNHVKQTFFIECLEGISYYDFRSYDTFQPIIWRHVAGETHFSNDGKFAAVVYTRNNVSTVTIVDMNVDTSRQRLKEPEFTHFNLASEDGIVMNGQFITISEAQHYFCFAKDTQTSIECLHIEDGFASNVTTTRTLPNSEGVCERQEDCRMYAHQCILVAKRCLCRESECEVVNMVFDMSTFQNRWNVTGIDADFQTFRPVKRNDSVAIATPATDVLTMATTAPETTPTTEVVTMAVTEAETTSTTSSATATTAAETETSLTTQPVTRPSTMTEHRTTPPRKTPPTTSSRATPTQHHDPDQLDACLAALNNSRKEYDTLEKATYSVSTIWIVVCVVLFIIFLVACCKRSHSEYTYSTKGHESKHIVPKEPIPAAVIGKGTSTCKKPGDITLV